MKRYIAVLAVWLALAGYLLAFNTSPEPVLSDGTKIQLTLPAKEHMQNTGGSDGAGLCVYTSVTLAAHWQNTTEMYGFRKFAEGRPGGSYPEKLAADIKTYCNRAGLVAPSYVQHTGGDATFLDLCIQTRRMPGITYAGKDDFYDSTIAHMVNLAHLDQKWGAIQDNNRAGKWTSDTRTRILNRWKGLDDNGKPLLIPFRSGGRLGWGPVGGGWAFVWLTSPPPPKPPGAAETIAPAVQPHRCGCWERKFYQEQPVWVYWSNGQCWGLFLGGKWYRSIDGTDSAFESEPSDPPKGLSPPISEPTDCWNKGIVTERIGEAFRYWINGIECSQAMAYAAVADPQGLIDDSDKYHLSFVGGDRKTIQAKFGPGGQFEKYARRLHVQIYAAGDWPTDYLNSAVTLQEPAKIGGKIVAIAPDASDAAIQKALSSVFDAPPPVRPDPPKQPDQPKQPDTQPDQPAPSAPKLPDWAIGALALGALLILKGRK